MANAGAPQSESKNVLSVDYANNNPLKTIFARKEVGDKCTLTIEAVVINKTPDMCTLAIKKVITEDYGDAEDSKVKPDDSNPVMITMRKKRGDKRGDSSPMPAPQSTARPTENSLGTMSYA